MTQTTDERTDMTTPQFDSCPCADSANVRQCRRRRAAAFAVILALATMVVWGETWAIEHAPALPSELVNVLGNGCADSTTPVAVTR
jgi:hypothetical protein